MHLNARAHSAVRRELGVIDIEQRMLGQADDPWSRYRDQQLVLLNGLQNATESILFKVRERNDELDRDREKRYTDKEISLLEDLNEKKKSLLAEVDEIKAALETKAKALEAREAAFNTKESNYVARQKQDDQIKQVQDWLKEWSVTKGTTQKRWPITTAYVVGIIGTGWLCGYATYHSYDLLKSADDIAKLLWWQWVALTFKTVAPLAACATFLIYFIRWSSAWAKQHAEEEFRNRNRLFDIGRSGWLLEAVRDAQQRNKEVPPELLSELGRNLFADPTGALGDHGPKALNELLLEAAGSISAKTPHGEIKIKKA